MDSENMVQHPHTLILSLRRPASLFVCEEEPDAGDVQIDGVSVDANDTPWAATVADLLIDKDARSFVGLTFQINSDAGWQPLKQLCERLDPTVTHYNEIAAPQDQLVYPGESGTSHRFEITWAKAQCPAIEWAQLLCGQWYWLYAPEGDWGISKPVVALQLDHVDEILDEHELSFPMTQLPPLNVRWRCRSHE